MTSYTDTGLTEATSYWYQVLATNSVGQSAPSSWMGVTTHPSAPTGLTASVVSGSEIDLSWTQNSKRSNYQYVDESTDGSTWRQVATLATSAQGPSSTVISGIFNGSTPYSFRVRVYSYGAGDSGFATTSVTTPAFPNQPTISSAASTSATSNTISWNDVSGETGFLVQRSSSSNGPWTTVGTLTTGHTSYVDTGLSEATSYWYQVIATNAAGHSAPSSAKNVATQPLAPTGLTATVVSGGEIDLTWTQNSTKSSYQYVEESADGTHWQQVATITGGPSGTNQFSVVGTFNGHTAYSFRVSSYAFTGGYSAYNTISVSTPAFPNQPTITTATAQSDTAISVQWDDVSGETSFVVQRGSASNGPWFTVATLGQRTTSFVDTGLSESQTYWYQVIAKNGSGNSAPSRSQNATTQPAPPSGLMATVVSGGQINLTWTEHSSSAVYHYVEESADGIHWQQVASLSGSTQGTISEVVTGSFNGSTAYDFRVYDYAYVGGYSAYSTTSITTPAFPNPPVLTSLTSQANASITITWDKPAGSTGFLVQRSWSANGPWTTVGTLGSAATTFTDTNLSETSTYWYQVIATNAAGSSAPSNLKSAVTPPMAPSDVTATVVSGSQINLSWFQHSYSAYVQYVEESTDGSTWRQVTAINNGTFGTNSAVITGAFSGLTTYDFRVSVSGITGGRSGYATATVVTPAFPDQPNLVSVTTQSDTAITLKWNALPRATGFTIQRATSSNGPWTTVATPGAAATTYTDSGLSEATSYWYQLLATDSAGTSAPSRIMSASTKPSAPTNLVATVISGGEIDLSWIDHSRATSYEVDQSTDGVTWHQIATLSGAGTVSDDILAAFNGTTTYHFRVSATVFGFGSSTFATTAVTTPAFPNPPTLVYATAQSDTAINLTWEDVLGETGFLVQRSTSSSGPWTTITTAATGATSYTDRNLSESTSYWYQVIASNGTGRSAASNTLEATTQPSGPSGLTARVVSGGAIDLSWTDHSSAATTYYVDESVDGLTWHQVASLSGASTTSYEVVDAFSGSTSYHFRVAAYTSAGGKSPYVAVAVTTPGFPNKPTLTTASTQSESAIALTWNNVTNATGFVVQRSLAYNGPWTTVGTTGSGVTSFTDTGLTENTNYYYQIIATNASGSSAPSSYQHAATKPSAPSGLVAAVVSGGEIDLSWTDHSSLASVYYVEESTDGANWHQVTYLYPNGTIPATSALIPGPFVGSTTYQFRVFTNAYPGGNSGYAVASATTPAFPSQPTLTSATAPSDTTVALTWNDVAGETGFIIQRASASTGPWTTVATTPAGSTSFTDSNLQENTTYWYEVIANNAAGESAPSGLKGVSTRPSAATGLSATVVSGGEIDLTWTNHSNVATSYEIDESTDGSNWHAVATIIGSGLNSASITGAFLGSTTYDFRVSANAYPGGASTYASTSIRTPSFSAQPTLASATPQSDSAISLSWNDVVGETGFLVLRSSTSSGPWITIATLPTGTTSYTDAGLPEATSYSYEIIATNASGNSAPSNVRNAATQPSAPTGLTATAISGGQVNLSWTNHSSNAGYYVVEESTDGSTWQQVGPLYGPTITNATISSSFSGSTTYDFRVHAYAYVGGSSDYASTTLTTRAFPGQPTLVSATPQSDTTITLSWNDVPGATGFIVQRASFNNGPWTPVGTTTSGVTSFTDAGLAEGTSYWYQVVATNANGNSAPSASKNAATQPTAPTGLSATITSGGQVHLTWTNHSAVATSNSIQQSTDGTNWIRVASLNGTGVTSATLTGPFDGSTTYQFRVQAYAYAGGYSNYAVATATTPAFPKQPTLVAGIAHSDTTIALTWNDVAGETGFIVQRASTSTGPWTPIGTTAAGVTSFTDTGLSEATSLWYEVIAINASGNSAPSNAVNAITPPSAPTALTASVISGGQINLSWTNHSTLATSYGIDESTDGSTWTHLTTLSGSGTTSAVVNGPFNGSTTYRFRVYAIASPGGTSAYATASVATPTFPNQPTFVSATPTSDSAISLAWNDIAGETGFIVLRATTNAGPWTPIATLAQGVTSFTDTGLHEAKTYWYEIVATNAMGLSAPSHSLSAVTQPLAPTDLTANVISGGQFILTWTNHSTLATSYGIDQSTDGTTWTHISTLAGTGVTSAIINGPFNGSTTYRFRVYAIASPGGTSAYATASVTTPTFPNQPTIVSATPTSDSAINLAWNNITGATGFILQRAAASTGAWTPIATLASGVTSFTDTGLNEVTSYWYQLIATNGAGNSAPSLAKNATTQPSPPTGLTASVVSGNQINLTWTDHSLVATNYVVEQSSDGTTWHQVASLNGLTVASATILGTFSGSTTYDFRVHAVSSVGGNSAFATTSVKTPAFPNQPTLVSASPLSDSTIALAWQDIAGETGFIVQRALGSNGPWTLVATLGSGVTSYTDTGLNEAKTYWYQVIAKNASGLSAPSNSLSAATQPSAPTGLTATVVSGGQITLTWVNHSTSAVSYVVDESTDGTTWFQIDSLSGTASPSITVPGPFTGATTYRFRVHAHATVGGISDYTSTSVTTPAFPKQPTFVSAIAQSDTAIALTWDDVPNETGFIIQRATAYNGPWTDVKTTAVGVTSYTDTGLSEATTYWYQLIAKSAAGTSAISNSLSSTTLPLAPTGLTATVVSGSQINLSWTNHSTAATYYDVYESTNGSNWQHVAYLQGSANTSVTITGPFDGSTTYDFRVRAFATNGGNSAYASATVISPAFPSQPTIASAVPQANSAIALSWNDVAHETGFLVQRSLASNGPWTTVATPAAGVTTFTDSGLQAGTAYWYQVIATNASGASAPSRPLKATPTTVVTEGPMTPITGTSFTVPSGVEYRGVVGQFTDTDTVGHASDFTATIDWGDGTAPTPGVILGSSGSYHVTGSHTYTSGASYPVTVALESNAGGTATIHATAKVGSSNPSASGLTLVAPSNGAISATVASFSIPPSASASSYTATIDWRDGTVDNGTISPTDIPGLYAVSGHHTYSAATDKTLIVSILDSQGHLVQVQSPITFATSGGTKTGTGTGGVTYSAISLVPSVGLSFNERVATFTDPNPADTAGSFTVTIDWGDGTTSAGSVVADPSGGFDVIGNHSFAMATSPSSGNSDGRIHAAAAPAGSSDEGDSGGVTVKVTSPGGAGFTATDSVSTDNPPITVSTKPLEEAFADPYSSDLPFQGVLATFTDPDPDYGPADFTATIDWGDGSGEEEGKVSGNVAQGYSIEDTHTFESDGTFDVTITIRSPDGEKAVEHQEIEVTVPPPNLSGQTLRDDDYKYPLAGIDWDGIVGTIYEGTNPAEESESPEDDQVEIDWGDGTTSDGEVVEDPDNSAYFDVRGSHTYADGAAYQVLVTVTDAAGNVVTAQSMALVNEPSHQQQQDSFGGYLGQFDVATRNVPYFLPGWDYETMEGDYGTIDWNTASVTINWGDGVEQNLPIFYGLNYNYNYKYYYNGYYGDDASHVFTEDGSFNVTMDISDVSNHHVSFSEQVKVSDPALALNVYDITRHVNDSASIGYGGQVAWFYQSDPMLSADDFSAVIDWGDGTVTPGKVLGGVELFYVTGDHSYDNPGAYTVRVIVASRDDGASKVTGRILVLAADAIQGGLTTHPVNDEAQVGEDYSGTVATFSDPDESDEAEDFTATIDWGDGKQSEGEISEVDGEFEVTGDHTYQQSNDYLVYVTITKSDGEKVVVPSSMRTLYPQIQGTPETPELRAGGIAHDAVLVELTGLVDQSAYYAKVDWGDGTTSNLQFTAQGEDGEVKSGHGYSLNGTYDITVTVSGGNNAIGASYVAGGAAFATFHLSVTITGASDPMSPGASTYGSDITSAGATVEAVEGEAFHGAVSTFECTRQGASAGDFIASISWGDGTTSTGTVRSNGNGFEVDGDHAYAHQGAYPIFVTIIDTTYVSLPLGDSYRPIPPQKLMDQWVGGYYGSYYYDEYYWNWDGYTIPIYFNGTYGNISYVFGAMSAAEIGTSEIELEDGNVLSAKVGEELSDVVLATGSIGSEDTQSAFSAIVAWGDGTESIVAVTEDDSHDGSFDVLGTHEYASPGKYTATITLYDGIHDYHATCVITIDPKTTSNGTSTTNPIDAESEEITATAGEELDDELIATFTDENPAHIGGTHVVTIDWGDHTTSLADVKEGEGDHEYDVYGSHTYAVPGDYIIHVAITDQTDTATTSGRAMVEGDHINASGTELENFLSHNNVVVATFTDENHDDVASDFQATIQMGDGSLPIVGEVYGGDGEFYVALPDRNTYSGDYPYGFYVDSLGNYWGSNSYGYGYGYGYGYVYGYGYNYWGSYGAYNPYGYDGGYYYGSPGYYGYEYGYAGFGTPGDRDVTVTIREASSVVATAESTLVAGDAVVGAPYLPPINAPMEPNTSYEYFVTDWGDGSQGLGSYHIYHEEGTYTITYAVKVFDRYANSWEDEGTETMQVNVSDAPLTSLFTSSQPINGFAGEELEDKPIYSFLDNDPDATVDEFTATIAWGDGTTSDGTIEKSDQGTFDVHATHAYDHAGKFTISILVEDEGGADIQGLRPASITYDAKGQHFGAYESVATGEVILATIADPEENLDADPTVTVDWGDGETSTATVVYNDEDKEYQILGNHTYSETGTYAVRLAIAEGNLTTNVGAEATIIPDWSISGAQLTNQAGGAEIATLGHAGIALNTGGLRISQELDFDLSPGTNVGGSPALVYNSDTVHARPIIQAELQSSEDDPVPESIKVQLTFNGVTQDWITYETTDHEPGDTYLLSAQVEKAVAQSGIYAWSMHVVLDFGGEEPEYNAELTGDARVVVNDAPAVDPDKPFESIDFFGAGWGLAGLDRLVVNADDEGDVLLVTGAGDSEAFTQNDDGTFTIPANDFGKLEQNDDGTYTYTTPNQTKYEFNRLGLMTKVTDSDKVSITYTYTDNGQLEQVKAPDGSVTTFTYDSESLLLESINEPGDRELSFAYDEGDLTEITDVDDLERTLTYDDDGHLTSQERGPLNADGSGEIDEQYTYGVGDTIATVNDGLGSVNLIKAAAAQGLGATVALNSDDAVTTVKDGRSNTTTFLLDFEGRILKEVSPEGIKQSWVRNAHGQVTKYTDGRGLVTTYKYDSTKQGNGDLLRVEFPDGSFVTYQHETKFHEVIREETSGPNGSTEVTLNTYDPNTGDLLTTTDPTGAQTSNVWNNGLLVSSTNALQGTTTYFYDGNRRLIRVTDPLSLSTTYTYDSHGNVETTTDPLRHTTHTVYDDKNRLVEEEDPLGNTTTIKYNALGEETETVDGRGITTVVEYDDRGLATETIEAFGSDDAQTSYTYYDADGNATTVINARGVTTVNVFDKDGRLTATTEAYGTAGAATSYTYYDKDSNPTTLIDARGIVTVDEYDDGNRVTSTTVAEGKSDAATSSTYYDEAGNATTLTDARGIITVIGYDQDNRITSTTEAYGSSNERTSYTFYDANGNVTKAIDGRGIVTVNKYDADDRLTLTSQANGTSDERTTQTFYDEDGNATTVIDANGIVTVNAYDADDRLTATTEAHGTSVARTTSTYYDENGNATTLIDGRGIVTVQEYDDHDRVTATIEAYGTGVERTSYTFYDANGNVIKTVDGRGITTVNEYDARDRATSTTEAYGTSVARTTYTYYDEDGNATTVIDGRGITTVNAFDGHGRVTSSTEAYGSASQRTVATYYDEDGNATTVIDGRGLATVTAYDNLGRATEVTEAEGSGAERSTFTYYDADDNVTTSIDGRGIVTLATYDNLNRATEVTEALGTADARTSYAYYDADDDLTTAVDGRGITTITIYDALNRAIDVTEGYGASNVRSSFTYYDADDNVTTSVDGRGITTVIQYDLLDRATGVTEAFGTSVARSTFTYYDADDNATTMIDGRGVAAVTAYDALNRATAVTQALGTAQAVTSYTYFDADDNATTMIDGRGITTLAQYDSLNRNTATTEAYGTADARTTYRYYDVDDNVTTTINGLGIATVTTYDGLNRATEVVQASGRPDAVTNYTYYDADDNVVTVIDADNNTTAFVFDSLNRQIRMTDPLEHSTVSSYDADDNLISTTDRDGRTITSTYNSLNQLVGQAWLNASGVTADSRTFTSDADNNLLTASNQNGSVTNTYSYDALNRVASATDPFGVTLSYQYDPNGNATSVQDSFGGNTVSTYDALNRLVSRKVTGAGSTTPEVDYTYDADNNLRTMTRFANAGGTSAIGTSSYGYDSLNRLTSLVQKNGSGATLESDSYTYDAADRQATKVENGQTTPYTYDDTSQLTSAGSASYSYDSNGNRTDGSFSTGPDNQITSDGTWNYTYDAEGNRTKKVNIATGVSWTYSYDNANHLTGAKELGSDGVTVVETVSFSYDAEGNRIEERITPGGSNPTTTTLRFAVDDSQNVWADLNANNGLQTRYLQGDVVDQILARIGSTGTVAWYLTDNLDSVRDLTDNTGVVQDHINYDAFGNITSESNASFGDRFKYTGREFDAATGLQYNRARYYDAAVGTWINLDPSGFSAGDPNLYRYVGNGPTNGTDPSGLADDPVNELFNRLDQRTPGTPSLRANSLQIAKDEDLSRSIRKFAEPVVAGSDAMAGSAVVIMDTASFGANAEMHSLAKEVERSANESGSLSAKIGVGAAKVGGRSLQAIGIMEVGAAAAPHLARTAVGSLLSSRVTLTVVTGATAGMAGYKGAESVEDFASGRISDGIDHAGESLLGALFARDLLNVPLGTARPIVRFGKSEAVLEEVESELLSSLPQDGKSARVLRELAAEELSTEAQEAKLLLRLSQDRFSPQAMQELTGSAPNRGVTWTTERTGRSSAARDWEDSVIGATSDPSTRMRNVPALRYDNPNPAGSNIARFDGLDPSNPNVLIDRKWGVTTKTDQVDKFRSGPLEALRQNPNYRLRIEVPTPRAATDARRLLRYATGSDIHPQIDIVVTPPLNP